MSGPLAVLILLALVADPLLRDPATYILGRCAIDSLIFSSGYA